MSEHQGGNVLTRHFSIFHNSRTFSLLLPSLHLVTGLLERSESIEVRSEHLSKSFLFLSLPYPFHLVRVTLSSVRSRRISLAQRVSSEREDHRRVQIVSLLSCAGVQHKTERSDHR